MTLEGQVGIAVFFGVPLASYFVLRRAGRTVAGAAGGAVLMWATIMGGFVLFGFGALALGLGVGTGFWMLAATVLGAIWWLVERERAGQ